MNKKPTAGLPAAIMDIDGTLVDTNYQHALAWYRAFRRFGEVLPVWRIHRHMGMGGDQVIEALCGERTEQAKGEQIRAAEKDLYAEMIGEVATTKPAPDLVAAGIEKAGGGSSVMVGDSTWDCESARGAGIETVAVLTGGYSEAELRAAGAVAVFESLPDLQANLDRTPLGG